MQEIRELRSQLEDPDYHFSNCLGYAIALINAAGRLSCEELIMRLMAQGFSEDLAMEVLGCIAYTRT